MIAAAVVGTNMFIHCEEMGFGRQEFVCLHSQALDGKSKHGGLPKRQELLGLFLNLHLFGCEYTLKQGNGSLHLALHLQICTIAVWIVRIMGPQCPIQTIR
jgi:hypothetical protein